MKKFITLFSVTAALLTSQVKGQFFEQTDYVGALSADVAKDWTTGWTNWTPKTTNYAAATDLTTLDASTSGKMEITTTVTLSASKVYLLKGFIVIKSGGKLVIPAGTLIRCEADLNVTPKNYASIVVERGGKIEINGTSSNPVVFTSNKAAGSRERGDWGGIILCGSASNNQGTDIQVEGFNNVTFDNALAKHGGSTENDNSGTITYCRLEFGGLAFEANKEINGLTFGSVGSLTTINGVQVSYSGDDSYEWFGGDVNCKHLIAYKGTDDDFDTDYGYRGAVQFGIGIKDTAYYDLSYNAPSGSSTSEGFESDNDGGGSGKTPYTNAVFSNMTMIGPVQIGQKWSDLGSVQQAAFRRGARIRRNSRLSVVNSVFMGYRNFVYFDGDSTQIASGATTGAFPNSMAFKNNLFVNSAAAFSPASSTANGLVEVNGTQTVAIFDAWIKNASNSNNVDPVAYTAKTVLEDPQNPTAPNFRPVSSSPALAGASFTHPRITSYGTFNAIHSLPSVGTYMVYPNPAKNVVNAEIEMSNSANVHVYVTDYNGRVLIDNGTQKLENGANLISVNTESLSSGLYLLVIESNQGKLSSSVLINK